MTTPDLCLGQTYLTDKNESITCIGMEFGDGSGNLTATAVIFFDGKERFQKTIAQAVDAINKGKIRTYTPPWRI